jgi:photosystem II stability/assembly factor-like uncharacterized protein
LNALSDSDAAARLDIAELTLRQLRDQAEVSNEGACKLPAEARNKVMAAYRKTFRSPDRATFRAPAKEWIRTWDMDESGRTPTSTDILRAEADRKALTSRQVRRGEGEQAVNLAAGISTSSWTALGPGNVGGRLRAVLIDPRDPNRILLGAATGGVWLSTNGGQSFSAIADFLGNIVIGAMAFDPVNPNIVYAGTGESFTGYQGVGMFKSTDRGVTWSYLSATSTDTAVNPSGVDWWYVNRIAVNAANPEIVLAGTTTGTSTGGITANGKVYRSTNGGASWSKVGDFQGLDVKFDPNNASNAIVGADDGYVYYSTDAGANWTRSMQIVSAPVGRGTPKTARIEVDYARSAPGTVYASVDNNTEANADNGRGQVWKSLDGGATWTMLAEPKHLSEQGDYNNSIWVSPVDERHVIVGGLDLYQSTDGGSIFDRISTWQQAGPGLAQPHADHNAIVHAPDYSAANPVVYFGNDGGLYRSTNVFAANANANSTWQNLNNNLAATQFYGGAGKRAAGGKIIGGTQDNGALMYSSGTSWERTAGGDGGFAAVDPIDDTTIYGEYVYASVHRKVGQDSRRYICSGITEALKGTSSNQPYCGLTNAEPAKANFIAPFIVDPSNRDRMLVGANSLWASNNIRSAVPTWAAIKPPITINGASSFYINAIAVFERDSNIIWVGHNSPGQIWKTSNGLSASPTWTQVGDGVLPSGTVSRVTIDPDNPNRAWVTYTGFTTGRIWQTTDGGATWQNIHGNLPRVSLHDIKRHPTQPNWLYVGAANGVYTSENGGQSWSTTNDGPASVRVRELFWYDPTTLVAVTYGRGMFRTTVASGGPANYSDMWWAGTAENGWGMSIQQHGQIQLNAMYVYDSAGKPIWYVLPGGAWNSDFTTYSGPIYQPTSAPLNNYSAAQFNVGAPVGNISINFTSNSTALLQYVINGVSGQKSIQRQVFGRGTSPIAVGDMWWGGTAQDGWGISITQQAGILFGAWYTYGPDGKATWYVMTDGTWSGNTYTGGFFSTLGSPWLGAPYNPSQLQVVPTGTLTLNFSDANNATMTYAFTAGPFAGTTQSKPIVRQPY